MLYIASIGGMVVTFLAGTEIEVKQFQDNFNECLSIGFVSFIVPFIFVLLLCFYVLKWQISQSLLVAVALSGTSIALVYTTIINKDLSGNRMGTVLIGSTFVTNICTALTLSILFMKPNLDTLYFIIASAVILLFSYKYSYVLFESKIFSMSNNELELKYIFLLLMVLIFFATLGGGQALLPVFILGVLLSKYFNHKKGNMLHRLQTVSFTVITPIFFIVAGTRISLPIIFASFGLFILILVVRQLSKFVGVYTISKYNFSSNRMYITMILSTGLTFGLVAAMYGLTNGIITNDTYSILAGILVLSTIIPTFIGNRFYAPKNKKL